MIDLSRERRFLDWLVEYSATRVIDLDTVDQRQALLEAYEESRKEVQLDLDKILSGNYALG